MGLKSPRVAKAGRNPTSASIDTSAGVALTEIENGLGEIVHSVAAGIEEAEVADVATIENTRASLAAAVVAIRVNDRRRTTQVDRLGLANNNRLPCSDFPTPTIISALSRGAKNRSKSKVSTLASKRISATATLPTNRTSKAATNPMNLAAADAAADVGGAAVEMILVGRRSTNVLPPTNLVRVSMRLTIAPWNRQATPVTGIATKMNPKSRYKILNGANLANAKEVAAGVEVGGAVAIAGKDAEIAKAGARAPKVTATMLLDQNVLKPAADKDALARSMKNQTMRSLTTGWPLKPMALRRATTTHTERLLPATFRIGARSSES